MIEVALTPYELVMATRVGMDRHLVASERKLQDLYGGRGDWFDSLRRHVLGAMGELAVARVTNRYWDGSVNTFRSSGDVGHWQVRTRENPRYELIVRPDDPDDARFYLARMVTDVPRPRLQVVGSLMGRDAKKDEWLKSYGPGRPAYFVPDDALEAVCES